MLKTQTPRFVSGFVGVIGADQDGIAINSSLEKLFSVTRSTSGLWYKVLSFGSTPATILSRQLFSGETLFKGRPFYVSEPVTSPRCNIAESAERNQLLENLDGKWSLCCVSENLVLCATDLLGAGPIYYCSRGNQFYLSTHLGVLLATLDERWEYDQLGIASILFSRGLVEGRTHVRGISRLGHGAYIAVERSSDYKLRAVVGQYADSEQVLRRTVSKKISTIARIHLRDYSVRHLNGRNSPSSAS